MPSTSLASAGSARIRGLSCTAISAGSGWSRLRGTSCACAPTSSSSRPVPARTTSWPACRRSGSSFAQDQYRIGQALANLLLLVIGVGAVLGVVAGGLLGDALIGRRHLNGRILTSAIAATATTILFIPALLAHGTLTAVPYLCAAAFALSAQTAPLDAARLDIMPPQLWGRAESIRSVIRSFAQALAPLLFGAISDHVFGGGRSGLQMTFALMLFPLAASAALLYRALGTYPRDVATAAATAQHQADAATSSSSRSRPRSRH